MKSLLIIFAMIAFTQSANADCIKDCLDAGYDYNFCEFSCRDKTFGDRFPKYLQVILKSQGCSFKAAF